MVCGVVACCCVAFSCFVCFYVVGLMFGDAFLHRGFVVSSFVYCTFHWSLIGWCVV